MPSTTLNRFGVLAATFIATAALASCPAAFAQKPFDSAARGKELITRAPFDKLILVDDSTWEIEPVAPRPLPVYDPKKVKGNVQKLMAAKPPQGNIGVGAAPIAAPKVEKDDDIFDEEIWMTVHMLEGDVRDYRVKREHVKGATYFEDMLIAEAGKLIGDAKFTKAMEYLLFVKIRDPKWPGVDDMLNRLLYEEGNQAWLDGDAENGLRLLTELHRRKPDYPGLGDKLANSYIARIKKAFEVAAYARGRQVLREFESVVPGHMAIVNAHSMYEGRARDLIEKADKAKGIERLDLLLAAASVWPKTPGLEAKYREAYQAIVTLDVAVSDLPKPIGPWILSAASERTARLLYRPILANMSDDAVKGALPDQLASEVEMFDLAKGIRITLKEDFVWSDGSRPVSAIDVARALADRAVPTLPGYSARWGDLLERVEPTKENQVEVRLTRPTLRPEWWLNSVVGPAHAGVDGWVTTVGQGRRPVGDGLYRWGSSKPGVDQYVVNAEDSASGPKVRRIKEIRYDSPSAALAAFARGDVSLIESIPPDRVTEIAAAPEVKVGRYATPSLHRIALDGRNEVLRNRKLRRAMSLAIDRKTLLEETVLHRPPDDVNTVADGPFIKGTNADVPDVAPLEYNPLLAMGLIAAAKTELGGGMIKMTLEYPPTTVARAVCPRLAEAWGVVGLKIDLKEVPEDVLEAKLRSGKRFDLAYRASRPGEPAFDVGPTITPCYDAPISLDPLAAVASPRILQLLMQLDRAPETTAAQALTQQIDRETRDELPILPLWQLVDHFAYRTRIKGIGNEIQHLYQGIETWEIAPWFPNDPW